MIVYFLRHASAGHHKVLPKQDEERPIDKIGERQSREMGRALAALDVEVDTVVSSPLVRAVQTAELVAGELGHTKKDIVISEAMRPEANYDQFHDLLTHYRNSRTIMVVGHNPSITEFLVQLLTKSHLYECVDFKKGAVAKVAIEEERGVLNWLLTPKMVSQLHPVSAKSSRPKTSRK